MFNNFPHLIPGTSGLIIRNMNFFISLKECPETKVMLQDVYAEGDFKRFREEVSQRRGEKINKYMFMGNWIQSWWPSDCVKCLGRHPQGLSQLHKQSPIRVWVCVTFVFQELFKSDNLLIRADFSLFKQSKSATEICISFLRDMMQGMTYIAKCFSKVHTFMTLSLNSCTYYST